MKVFHVPRLENNGINLSVLEQIWTWFWRVGVDLLTKCHNSHSPHWFCMDAFAHMHWSKEPLFAFLPLHLIPPLLQRVRKEQLSFIMVAPERHSAMWYDEMTCMFAAQQWTVPQFRRALSQEEGAMGSLPILCQPLRVCFPCGTG